MTDFTKIQNNFAKHGFSTKVFETKEEASDYLAEKLQHRTIGFGGSVTLKEMGLYDRLQENNTVIWHNRIPSAAVRRLASSAEVYICSANAVAETGEILNIDGTGNRVSMTAFGPSLCIYVVGRNKIALDLTAAYKRAKNIACPKNAQRVGAKTPCAVRGDKCYNCNSPERICRVVTVVERPPMGMDAGVLFVDEDLGY